MKIHVQAAQPSSTAAPAAPVPIADDDGPLVARALRNLAAAGFRVLGPGELDGQTIARVSEALMGSGPEGPDRNVSCRDLLEVLDGLRDGGPTRQ